MMISNENPLLTTVKKGCIIFLANFPEIKLVRYHADLCQGWSTLIISFIHQKMNFSCFYLHHRPVLFLPDRLLHLFGDDSFHATLLVRC